MHPLLITFINTNHIYGAYFQQHIFPLWQELSFDYWTLWDKRMHDEHAFCKLHCWD